MTDDTDTDDHVDELVSNIESADSDSDASDPADEERIGDGGSAATRSADHQGPPLRSLEEYVELGTLAGLLLLGVVAAFGFYTSASTAIDRLVAEEYRPMYQAAFNLVVVLVSATGVSVLLRRRTASDP